MPFVTAIASSQRGELAVFTLPDDEARDLANLLGVKWAEDEMSSSLSIMKISMKRCDLKKS
ncbi:MAG: hypothetical protein G01um101420_709 [Parcubacteria group bacterium Gr01-1014_20]|nr:MAG: hypothetical protein G01um101420_709 [Parcubacteria group bacterium Gr01-1014_20]